MIKELKKRDGEVLKFFIFLVVLIMFFIITPNYFANASKVSDSFTGNAIVNDIYGGINKAAKIEDSVIPLLNLTYDNSVYDFASDIDVDKDENIYVASSEIGARGFDLVIIKYDKYGNMVWKTKYENKINIFPTSIRVDSFGNVYIVGYNKIKEKNNWFLLKYDYTGELIWDSFLDEKFESVAHGVSFDPDGNIYVCGFIFNGKDNDLLVLKYDLYGNKIWNYTYSDLGDDSATSLIADKKQNVFVTGFTRGSNGFDFLTLKINITGSEVFKKFEDLSQDDFPQSIDLDIAGNIYVGGYSKNNEDYSWKIVKYSPSGDKLFVKEELWTRGIDKISSLKVDYWKNVYVAGLVGGGTLSENSYINKYNSDGSLIWKINIGKERKIVKSIDVDFSRNLYSLFNLNRTKNYDYEIIKFNDTSDYFLLSSACIPKWECEEWSECKDLMQIRICTDANSCGVEFLKPIESRDCFDEISEYGVQEKKQANYSLVSGDISKTEWVCENWSDCMAIYDIESLIKKPSYTLLGQQSRLCVPKKGRNFNRVELQECYTRFNVKVKKVKKCSSDVIEVSDLNGNLMSNIKYERSDRDKLNIDIPVGNNYCPYCYDNLKNFDETGVDCGGSCASCS